MGSSTIANDNRLQPVTQKDYQEVEKLWEENYRTLPVPTGFNDNKQGRVDWIEKEIEEIEATLTLLTDSDEDKKKEGLDKVGTILPFLLLGGFSYQEIVSYLNFKLQAAKTVLAELKDEEKVDVNVNKIEEPKALAEEEKVEENK